jgi:hypothetical protein
MIIFYAKFGSYKIGVMWEISILIAFQIYMQKQQHCHHKYNQYNRTVCHRSWRLYKGFMLIPIHLRSIYSPSLMVWNLLMSYQSYISWYWTNKFLIFDSVSARPGKQSYYELFLTLRNINTYICTNKPIISFKLFIHLYIASGANTLQAVIKEIHTIK